jgi:hypothetical protein
MKFYGMQRKNLVERKGFSCQIDNGNWSRIGLLFFLSRNFFQSSNQALNLNKENLNQTKFLGSFQKK